MLLDDVSMDVGTTVKFKATLGERIQVYSPLFSAKKLLVFQFINLIEQIQQAVIMCY